MLLVTNLKSFTIFEDNVSRVLGVVCEGLFTPEGLTELVCTQRSEGIFKVREVISKPLNLLTEEDLSNIHPVYRDVSRLQATLERVAGRSMTGDGIVSIVILASDTAEDNKPEISLLTEISIEKDVPNVDSSDEYDEYSEYSDDFKDLPTFEKIRKTSKDQED